jgi:arabinogalactan oligomer / maltooligosaccharide transport system substrate-binding protein
MTKKRFGVVGVIAAAALAVSVMVVPTATAAKKSIVIWADETRGPALEKIVKQMEAEVPGYKVVVKSFASYDALNAAWDKATVATGPDIVLRDGGLAVSGSKSGRIQSLIVSSATRAAFSKAAFASLTIKGKVYGIPTDADTTAMIYNTALMPTAPKTIQDIYDYYTENKTSKGLSNGVCSFNGTWGAQPMLTALGGGTWAYKGTTADFSKVVFNSPAFKANAKKYLLGADGKTNGFFSFDGCDTAFKAGKVPVALVGAWNLPQIQTAGIKYAWGSLPGVKAGTFGNQWVGYAAAYMTSYATSHGVKVGANQLLNRFFASKDGQLALNEAQKAQRPLAHLEAAEATKDADAAGIGQSSRNAVPQLSAALDNKTGGASWYDVSSDALKDIFAGKDLNTTLDKAAAVLAKNFADAAKS